ncbi:hypothetical protein KIW84_053034 [Lathyrus oleraceus]|uniref:Retroviral polymerase SH3-like domain-containing protein n=1 Tax=Pisum sativum TaxID=3888 RepID=A0A9D4WP85_PEA|nr:hypothetical protein KIW84_053034 [Pisum sativum]
MSSMIIYRLDKSYSGSNDTIESNKQGNHNALLASQNSAQDYNQYFDNGSNNHVTRQTYKFQDLIKHHGRAERKHKNIIEFGLTLLAQAKMPLSYWWEAFSTAVYLINMLPSSVTQNENPYSLLFKKEPDYTSLKPFGYACYPCLKPYNRHRLQFHITICVFLGYNNSHKGYKCLNSHGRIFISRHMAFNEEHFPFHDGFLNTMAPLQTLVESSYVIFPLFFASTSSSNTLISTRNHSDIEQEPVNPFTRLEDNIEQATNDSTSSIEHAAPDEPRDLDEPITATIHVESNSGVIHTRSKRGI